MDLLLDDLTINLSGINNIELLNCWGWLVEDIKEILLISKMGDMFLSAKDATIYWLATDEGSLTKVANNKEEFDRLLCGEDNLDNWFLPLIVEKLLRAGKLLNTGQVYSFKKLPVLGGEYAIDNLDVIDVKIHFEITGIMHEQIKDLPDGTKVKIKLV